MASPPTPPPAPPPTPTPSELVTRSAAFHTGCHQFAVEEAVD
jgi:hypothetical protein